MFIAPRGSRARLYQAGLDVSGSVRHYFSECIAIVAGREFDDIDRMSKLPKRTGSGAKAPKAAKNSQVLGVTSDGVRILKPKGRATHFTVPELEAAISRVRAKRAAG
jgi:hypothetical protein